MKYIPNVSCKDEMLKEMGMTADDLFKDIPAEFHEELDLPDGLSEPEVIQKVTDILAKNKPVKSFLGGGVWQHYTPAHIPYVVGRSEFLTAYTPYQAEISQGIMQTLFEYQSMMAELIGLGAVNSSMYDWSTALGEACLMSTRITNRETFLVPDLISPERLQVLQTWAKGAGIKVTQVAHSENGQLDLNDLEQKLSDDVAGVYIENPAYLGYFQEEAKQIGQVTHATGALFVMGFDPVSLGVAKPPGDYEADIAIGEAQPLGTAMNYGGPLLGIFAVKNDLNYIRKMPGRMMGLTEDADGKRGFVMTLQTREQHIRRAKATSNICTNEALLAVNAAVYLATLGKSGIVELGELCMRNADYAMKRLNELEGFEAPVFDSTHFKEFTVRSAKDPSAALLKESIHPGHGLGQLGLEKTALYCVTDTHTKEDLDRLVEVCSNV